MRALCLFMLVLAPTRSFLHTATLRLSRFTLVPRTPQSTSLFSMLKSTTTSAAIEPAAAPLSRTVLVAVAHGTEEIEAVTVIDTLVRAGAKVTTASVSDNIQVTCSRGVKIEADVLISAVTTEKYDLIVLPGGMPGATHLRESVPLQQMLTKQHAEGKLVAAICAAPAVVLQPLGILQDKRATCYPAPKFRDTLQPTFVSNDAVVVDGNIITSQGPGSSLQFSIQLAKELFGKDTADKLKKEMLEGI